MASKTDKGFRSYFETLFGEAGYGVMILKGGPGSGKSTLMKRVALALRSLGHEVEQIPCASDPASLDAVIDRTARRAIIDGTAPHMLDPVIPGARDALLHLGEAWDERALHLRAPEVMRLTREVDACHAQAGAFIAAAGALLARSRALSVRHVDEQAVRTALEALPFPQMAGEAETEYRLLSAVSVGRTAFFRETPAALCKRMIAVEDEWGAAADALLNEAWRRAREAKHFAILCPCSVCAGKLDHLLLPQSGICLSCANAFHDLGPAAGERLGGLYHPISPHEREAMQSLVFHARTLIENAQAQVGLAKDLHDELERIYVAAMDFSKFELFYARILAFFNQ